MKRIEDFSVKIVNGHHRNDDYVEMRHDTEYAIFCRNYSLQQCDAQISVDGEEIGTWRIPACGSISIERPADAQRKLTFYKLGSTEGGKAGLTANPDLGVVSVKFMPEIERFHEATRSGSRGAISKGGGFFDEDDRVSYGMTYGAKGLSAGGTGLGASSSQRFGSANAIVRDPSKTTIINLQLVCVDEPDIIPLKSRSNPVPPPLA